MKSVQRIIFSILTLVVIMSMANPVFAEEQKKVKLYDTEMNLISTFQSETELENYLENMPALHFEGGCGIDPTRQHGSKTYKKYFDRGYDYDTNTPTVLYRLYCYW